MDGIYSGPDDEFSEWLNNLSPSPEEPFSPSLDFCAYVSSTESPTAVSSSLEVTVTDLSEISLMTPGSLIGDTESPKDSSPGQDEPQPVKENSTSWTRGARLRKTIQKPASSSDDRPPVKQTRKLHAKKAKASVSDVCREKPVEQTPESSLAIAPCIITEFLYRPSQIDRALLYAMESYGLSSERLVDFWLQNSGGQVSDTDKRCLAREWDARTTLFKQLFPTEAKTLIFNARAAPACGIDVPFSELFPEATAVLMKLGHQYLESPSTFCPSIVDIALVTLSRIYPRATLPELLKALLAKTATQLQPGDLVSLTHQYRNRLTLYKERFSESYQAQLRVGNLIAVAGAPSLAEACAMYPDAVINFTRNPSSRIKTCIEFCYTPSQLEQGLAYLLFLNPEATMESVLLRLFESNGQSVEVGTLNKLAIQCKARLDLFEVLYRDEYEKTAALVNAIKEIDSQASLPFYIFFPDAARELSAFGTPLALAAASSDTSEAPPGELPMSAPEALSDEALTNLLNTWLS